MYRKALFFAPFFLLMAAVSFGQSTKEKDAAKPKLVVGIVVDQMREEFLYRFADKYSENGFKRLMREGFNNRNTHYNYIPTFTGPGHASVYTGSTPAGHGIAGNSWFDRNSRSTMYCVSDTTVETVGSDSKKGLMSPKNNVASTVTDELKLSGSGQSKVVSVSIKDRGAILPGGHMADGAYWYDGTNGRFISSTFYMEDLPKWVSDFNARNLADEYLKNNWNTLFPIDKYTQSAEDDRAGELTFEGKKAPVFPYNLKKLRKKNGDYKFLTSTPWGNTIVKDVAMAAIEGENLGNNGETDFLAVSFSSTDIIGHGFGPQSKEIQDTYLRLDRDIADLLSFLDEKVGEGNYMLFLTSDHGVAEIPAYLMEKKQPAGYLSFKEVKSQMDDYLEKMLGEGEWIIGATNDQIYLNQKLIAEKGLDLDDIRKKLVNYSLNFDGITAAYSASDIYRNEYTQGIKGRLQLGYYPKRSGDVLLVLDPAWIHAYPTGTTHGSGYTYDTHVPLLWFGWGVEQGESVKYQTISDIAPTVAFKLKIKTPNSAIGQPIKELF
ncbi:alkaline phosphatase PafA [Xanthovirga aplysinae]|uniref:alkaline phosphatase PafA n=1 Tax=Xanthovirga aplysinae TaxID=2529853 RepID=UPI0012BB998C|nr:alkaline phosphatase PafA [Xanthovirga aplysinae]MTI30575.1 alkaline phosphatase family protein [Xanthovirga aplysinae]